MQYVIKLSPKASPKFAQHWDGNDWTDDIDEARHYNARSDAEDEVRSLREDEQYDPDTHTVTIEERS